jgi:hypothetical protein
MGWTSLALAAVLTTSLATSGMAGGLPDTDPETLVTDWLTVLYSGETAKLDHVLSEHFQVSLGSGRGFTREGALKAAPVVNSDASVSNLVITRSETLIVARYDVQVEQMIEGELQSKNAPRLTVFELHEDGWYVTAHASFAVPIAAEGE